MYKSPIEIVVSQVQEMILQKQEEQTLQAVQKVGIKADKNELLKALAYDRGQYEKGYEDAVREFVRKFEFEIKDLKVTLGQTWEIQMAIKTVIKKMLGEEKSNEFYKI